MSTAASPVPSDRLGRIVLDPCCGHRSFWFDSSCPVAVFGDVREGEWELCDGRAFDVSPDVSMDFTAIPYQDGSFGLVVFDPPHLLRAGSKSYMAIKYGRLEESWRDDLASGFSECFRVLRDGGTLVFKWCEYQVPLRDALALSPYRPLFGNRKPGNDKTHWVVFVKDERMAA